MEFGTAQGQPTLLLAATLYHVAGTYLVVGHHAWPRHIPSVLHQPGDRAGVFRVRIVRFGDN